MRFTYPDQALLAWPPQLRGSQRGRREVAEGASACAAATACPWRVWRGSKIADAGLQDTQTAVPRPATVAQSAASSCALDGDRPAGSCLGTGACYDDGVACSPDIRTTKQERRLQRRLIHKDNVHDRRSHQKNIVIVWGFWKFSNPHRGFAQIFIF